MRVPGPLSLGSVLALGLLSGCGGLRDVVAPRGDGFRLRFEEVEAPEVFEREARARRGGPDAAPGLWAAVSGLPRAETGLVQNVDSGAEVRVALFVGWPGATDVVLSADAADALGVEDQPLAVRVVVLRDEPRLAQTANRF